MRTGSHNKFRISFTKSFDERENLRDTFEFSLLRVSVWVSFTKLYISYHGLITVKRFERGRKTKQNKKRCFLTVVMESPRSKNLSKNIIECCVDKLDFLWDYCCTGLPVYRPMNRPIEVKNIQYTYVGIK